MLLLDDGTHFTYVTTAATKSVKASHRAGLNWMHRVHWQVQLGQTQPPTQVFLDSVVQRMRARQSIPQQTVRQQRSFLEAISSQVSALPPPVVRQSVSPLAPPSPVVRQHISPPATV